MANENTKPTLEEMLEFLDEIKDKFYHPEKYTAPEIENDPELDVLGAIGEILENDRKAEQIMRENAQGAKYE